MALCVRPEPLIDCCCPPTPSSSPEKNETNKNYFHEVGAEMVHNKLIIRMEKKKSRKKSKSNWEPPCDCDVIEIKRPTNKRERPKIVNGGDNNQILFRIHSKGHLHKKDDPNYKPQAIAYRVNRSENDHCRKITVYPQLGGPVAQDVYTDHITGDINDIYLLRVKKRNDANPDGKKRNLEVELTTPKPPVIPAKRIVPPINETVADEPVSPTTPLKKKNKGKGATKEKKKSKEKGKKKK